MHFNGEEIRAINFPHAHTNGDSVVWFTASNVVAAYERLKSGGAPIVADLKDEAWGQRHFLLKDPGGVTIDIVESIEPAAGFYDKYQVRQ